MKLLEYSEYTEIRNFKITDQIIENLISYDIKEHGIYVSADGILFDENNEMYDVNELFGMRRKTPAERELAARTKRQKELLKQDNNIAKGIKNLKKAEKAREKAGERRTGLKVVHDAGTIKPFTIGKNKKALMTPAGKIIAIGTIATGALLLLANVIRKKMSLKKKMEEMGEPDLTIQNNYDTLNQKEIELRDKIRTANAEARQDETSENMTFKFNENLLEDIKINVSLYNEILN